MTLSENEYNGLTKVARKTKCDCWFDIRQDKNGNDYVFDLENHKKLSVANGVLQLADAIVDPLSDYGLTEDEAKAVDDLIMDAIVKKMYKKPPRKTKNAVFTVNTGFGTVHLRLKLGLYDVAGMNGEPLTGLGLLMDEVTEDGKLIGPYGVLTTSFGEFIGLKNCVYIDVNNCPYAGQILTHIGKNTGFTHRSGFVEYPAWIINEDLLKQLDADLYKQYSDKYDEYMDVFEK